MNRTLDGLGQKLTGLEDTTAGNMVDLKGQLSRVFTSVEKGTKLSASTENAVHQLQGWIQNHEQMQSDLHCLHALYFPEMRKRQDDVANAHEKTFGWILDPIDDDTGDEQWKFRKWVRTNVSGNNVFWISGKPGSGKSTLMKFIAHHDQLRATLADWGENFKLLVIEYYFWKSGSSIQKSLEGLLRSILHQILSQCPELIQRSFPGGEWLKGGPTYVFTKDDLVQGLRSILRDASSHRIRVFFVYYTETLL
jgi:hypothetical protein